MNVIRNKYLSPEVKLTTLDKITSLLFEHRVLVGDSDKLFIAETFGVGDIGKVRVPFFTELSNNQRFIQLQSPIRRGESKGNKLLTLFSFKKFSGLLLLSM